MKENTLEPEKTILKVSVVLDKNMAACSWDLWCKVMGLFQPSELITVCYFFFEFIFNRQKKWNYNKDFDMK
jgi:hypothetical protein